MEGLLVLINTVGGDVEAGLALAELIASISKPSATVVLGGGHSIGIPLAVSARRSFIVPTATMTVHPVRHSGMILGVPETMRWFEQMQERITGFVAGHSGITAARYSELMLRTGELVMDVGTMLDGKKAVKEKLIDQLGGISDALDWLYRKSSGQSESTGLPGAVSGLQLALPQILHHHGGFIDQHEDPAHNIAVRQGLDIHLHQQHKDGSGRHTACHVERAAVQGDLRSPRPRKPPWMPLVSEGIR